VRGGRREHNRQLGRCNPSSIQLFSQLDMSETEMDPWALMVKTNEGRLSFHPSQSQLHHLETNKNIRDPNEPLLHVPWAWQLLGQPAG
jgi:hypothetical protein